MSKLMKVIKNLYSNNKQIIVLNKIQNKLVFKVFITKMKIMTKIKMNFKYKLLKNRMKDIFLEIESL